MRRYVSPLKKSSSQNIDIHSNMDESQKHYLKWKKSNAQDCTLIASIYMKFYKAKL